MKYNFVSHKDNANKTLWLTIAKAMLFLAIHIIGIKRSGFKFIIFSIITIELFVFAGAIFILLISHTSILEQIDYFLRNIAHLTPNANGGWSTKSNWNLLTLEHWYFVISVALYLAGFILRPLQKHYPFLKNPIQQPQKWNLVWQIICAIVLSTIINIPTGPADGLKTIGANVLISLVVGLFVALALVMNNFLKWIQSKLILISNAI